MPSKPTTAERAAGLVSLLSVAAAAALVLVGVARNVLAVVVAALSLLLCAGSGWYAVSRRRNVRLTAVAVMALALVLVVVALVFADTSVLRVTLAGVLAVVSVVSARYALRRTPQAIGHAFPPSPTAQASRYPVLIMNLKSGGGKAERFRLAEECQNRDIESVILRPGDDLLRLAEDAVARGADVIGMAGGDGSQALVAAVAASHGVSFVCVPAGTRNHFALDLGLDRDDVVGALDAFAAGVERRVDLARVNGRTFVNNASLGLYANVVQSPQYREAKMRTAATKLPDLLGPDAAPLDLPFTGPDGTRHPTAQLILVSNNPYQLTHAGGRGTRQRIDRGVLGIVAARITNAAEASRFAVLEAAGQVERFAGWLQWTAERFEIRSAGPVQIGLDGETIEMQGPLNFESQPCALRVRMPRHAVGVSPAGRAVRILARSTLAQLARVAAGSETAYPKLELMALCGVGLVLRRSSCFRACGELRWLCASWV